MVCQTVRANQECVFMTKKGCSFMGGSCLPIIDKCENCSKIIEYDSKYYCSVYPNPSSKWLRGRCPMATHVKTGLNEESQKINPLKASKRLNKKA